MEYSKSLCDMQALQETLKECDNVILKIAARSKWKRFWYAGKSCLRTRQQQERDYALYSSIDLISLLKLLG